MVEDLYKVKVVSKLDGRSRPALVSYQNGKPIGDLVALDDPSVFSTTSTHAHSSDSKKIVAVRSGFVLKIVLMPVPCGAVQFPQTKKGNNSSSNKAGSDSKPKRKFRIFKRNK